MPRKELFSYFNLFPFFTKQAIFGLAERFGMGEKTLNTNIQRSIKRREIISLKRSLYVTRKFFDKNKGKTGYDFYISNILLSPSYVSRESALQYYGILSEGISRYTTSVTTKTTRKFKNDLGIFEYKKIKNDFFTGFVGKKMGEFNFLIALPHKAIFDYLYYQIGLSKVSVKNLESILDEFRINYEELPKGEMKRLKKMIKSNQNE